MFTDVAEMIFADAIFMFRLFCFYCCFFSRFFIYADLMFHFIFAPFDAAYFAFIS